MQQAKGIHTLRALNQRKSWFSGKALQSSDQRTSYRTDASSSIPISSTGKVLFVSDVRSADIACHIIDALGFHPKYAAKSYERNVLTFERSLPG
jgi:hypothetical protein